MVHGRVQKEGKVIHIIVRHCENWSKLLRNLSKRDYKKISTYTLSPRDEKDGYPFKIETRKRQKRNYISKDYFLMQEI